MCMSSPSMPQAPPLPAAAPPPPTMVDPSVIAARNANRSKAALAAGRGASITTSAQGLDTANSAPKTALGQ